MTELTHTTLENEMDLTLAYKKSIAVTEKLGLTLSTRTTFSTAVSEVCREVIDKAMEGYLSIGILWQGNRFSLCAAITFKPTDKIAASNTGFDYAQKLVPYFIRQTEDGKENIKLKLSIPKSLNLGEKKIRYIKAELKSLGPVNSYEEIKLRKDELQQANIQNELELISIKYLHEQKDEFLSIASHEINAPLTIAHSFAQMAVLADNGANTILSDCIRKVEVQTAKLVKLTRQLLDISRMETGNFKYELETISVNQLVREVTDNAGALLMSHKINIDYEPDDCYVCIDKIKIDQVFNNILGNAGKFSDAGSDIVLKIKIEEGRLQFSISDQGIGMPPQVLNNIFNKFYRGNTEDKKFSGLGMGLYVASTIVRDHGGSISAVSKPESGTTLTVELPLVAS